EQPAGEGVAHGEQQSGPAEEPAIDPRPPDGDEFGDVRPAEGHGQRSRECAAPLEPQRTQAVLPERGVARVVADGREKAGRATELLQRPWPAPETERIEGPEQDSPLRPVLGGEDPRGGRPSPRA